GLRRGDGGTSTGCGRNRRRRGGVTFSQAHRRLRRGADLPVNVEAAGLLVGLDLRDGAGADLAVDLGAHSLLHGSMVAIALRLEGIPGRHINEMPILAVSATLSPVPAVGLALTLHPFLDRARMDIDSKAITMIRQARSCSVRATRLLHPPHTLKDTVRRL